MRISDTILPKGHAGSLQENAQMGDC